MPPYFLHIGHSLRLSRSWRCMHKQRTAYGQRTRLSAFGQSFNISQGDVSLCLTPVTSHKKFLYKGRAWRGTRPLSGTETSPPAAIPLRMFAYWDTCIFIGFFGTASIPMAVANNIRTPRHFTGTPRSARIFGGFFATALITQRAMSTSNPKATNRTKLVIKICIL